MYDIAIITANYDNYDTIKPVIEQSGAKVEWVAVTDDYNLVKGGPHSYEGYTLHYQPRENLHPNRAAKFPKMKPQEYTNADKSVWIDASFRVTSSTFAIDILDILEETDIAQFEHPWRDCIFDEAEETLKLARYADVHDLVNFQIDTYLNPPVSHPRHWGLWATGIIARNHTSVVNDFGRDWLFDNLNFSYQDQISHPPTLRYHNLRPFALPGTHFSNPWLSYEGSGRHQ